MFTQTEVVIAVNKLNHCVTKVNVRIIIKTNIFV